MLRILYFLDGALQPLGSKWEQGNVGNSFAGALTNDKSVMGPVRIPQLCLLDFLTDPISSHLAVPPQPVRIAGGIQREVLLRYGLGQPCRTSVFALSTRHNRLASVGWIWIVEVMNVDMATLWSSRGLSQPGVISCGSGVSSQGLVIQMAS